VISGATRCAAVIGDPVRHSLSPLLHNTAYRELGLDIVYLAFEVPAGSTATALDAVRTLGLIGLSVTMPHKEAAAVACDELTDDAARLQSVNTVTPTPDGRMRGDSTDGEGFVRALRAAGHDPAGARVLVLGAGGAARAVSLALHRAGAAVEVAARRADAAARVPYAVPVAWETRAEMDADIVVNATPVGMGGDTELVIVPRVGTVYADLVYHPLETALLSAARSIGAPTVDGLGMLVHQAALQVEQWVGCPAPVDAMRTAVA
jgi:shikimate dehydrogenase